ncbi:MAG: DUF4296 domain-containing protein [Bacteroidia bacterium]|nr:DUF4296 domain-containing protein [Bacteroidia bacterium]
MGVLQATYTLFTRYGLSRCLIAAIYGSIWVWTGCATASQPPENLLPPAQMQTVLADMHFVDALSEKAGGELQDRINLREELYDEILEKNNLSREHFYQSYGYYLDHPALLDTIYKAVMDTLEIWQKRETQLANFLKDRADRAKADSLRARNALP